MTEDNMARARELRELVLSYAIASVDLPDPVDAIAAALDVAEMRGREMVAAEAYQVIGALAEWGGLFDEPEVIRALDYFARPDTATEILPWGPPPSRTPGG